MAHDEDNDILSYWTDSCSICFENRCEFNFPGCQDQFCTECIARYLTEVINNSWGLSMCVIKCPVCYDVLPKSTWSKYVDSRTLERYERYNRPFRGLTRHCSRCGCENSICAIPAQDIDEVDSILARIEEELSTELQCPPDVFQVVELGRAATRMGASTIGATYESLLRKITEATNHAYVIADQSETRRLAPQSQINTVASIMGRVIRLESKPENWKKLQHTHARNFPLINCHGCSMEMCFHCGEASWHPGLSCEQYLKVLFKEAQIEDSDRAATLKWKLEKSKRCPSCSILINREEGCNKVDCLHCGSEFCWVCLNSWSERCGFFKCATQKEEMASSDDLTSSATSSTTSFAAASAASAGIKVHAFDKTEIGVPNVSQIEKKLAVVLETHSERRRSTQINRQPRGNAFVKDWLFASRSYHFAPY